MGYVVKMPKLGLEMEQGTVLEWKVGRGNSVSEGDVIAEIETEKSIGEVEAREDGVLRRIYVGQDETVPPGTPIGIIAAADADIAELEAEAEAELEGIDVQTGEVEAVATGAEPAATEQTPAATDSEPTPERAETKPDVKASPRAKKRAEELDIDLTTVEGTGPQGAITADDVETAAEATEATEVVERPEAAVEGIERITPERPAQDRYQSITTVVNPDVTTALIDTTQAAGDAVDAAVSVTDVMLVALSATLADHRRFNATFTEATHHLHEHQHIAVVVETNGEVIAPVIPDVDERPLGNLVETRRELTKRALADDLADEERTGGTFTLANVADLDGEDAPVGKLINPPGVACLEMNPVRQRVIPNDVADLQPYVTFDLTYDTRAVDADAARQFLDALCETLNRATELVLETYRT